MKNTRPILRAVPLAVLCAVVLFAVVIRRRDRGTTTTTTTAATSSEATTTTINPNQGTLPPLRGPSPPPKAEVSTHAPRMAHGDPRRTNRSSAHGPKTASRVAYRVSVGGPVAAQVTTSPDESVLYVATLNGELVALSRADGSRKWSVMLGERAYGAPLVHDDGTIYVGSDAKKVFAFSPAKGDSIFRVDTEGEVDTSATFGKDGTILVSAGNQLLSLRRAGDAAWRFTARGKIFTSPAVTTDGLVIVGSQDRRVYALGANGSIAWSTDLRADVDGAPTISDDGSSIYVGTDAGEVVCLARSGKVEWRTSVTGFVRGNLSLARNGDVLVGTYGPSPRLVRIAADGELRGSFPIRGTGAKEFGIHGGPVEDEDGTLYFGAQDDAVYAVSTDGTQRWRFQTGADVDAPLTLLSDGSLVVPSEDGTVTLLLP